MSVVQQVLSVHELLDTVRSAGTHIHGGTYMLQTIYNFF